MWVGGPRTTQSDSGCAEPPRHLEVDALRSILTGKLTNSKGWRWLAPIRATTGISALKRLLFLRTRASEACKGSQLRQDAVSLLASRATDEQNASLPYLALEGWWDASTAPHDAATAMAPHENTIGRLDVSSPDLTDEDRAYIREYAAMYARGEDIPGYTISPDRWNTYEEFMDRFDEILDQYRADRAQGHVE